jgi:hypothetical protein
MARRASADLAAVSRRAFSIAELLVTIAICGALVGLLLPAVQRSREAARAMACRLHLRSVAGGTLQFAGARGCFPPARLVPARNTIAAAPSATWLVRVMPYLDEAAAAASWDDARPYDAQVDAVRAHVVPIFLCPSRRGVENARSASGRTPDRFAACGCLIPGRTVIGGAVVDFGGNHGDSVPGPTAEASLASGVIVTAEHLAGTSRWTPRLRPADISDGLSRTVLTAELHVPRDRLGSPPENGPAYDATDFFASSRVGGIGVPLADGPDDDVVGMGLFAFGSWHPGVCHMAFGDGRVEAVSTAIASDVLAAICNRSDASQ